MILIFFTSIRKSGTNKSEAKTVSNSQKAISFIMSAPNSITSFSYSSQSSPTIPKSLPEGDPVFSDDKKIKTSILTTDKIEENSQPEKPKEVVAPELEEERSKWMSEILTEKPKYLALRERTRKLNGGYSFANITHTTTVSSLASVNRETILELVSQHLRAIGFNKTAEILEKETGLTFQDKKQNWTRTDLLLLTSLAVGHRENSWDIKGDPFHQYYSEYVEEDFFSSPYREDPSTIWDEYFNPNKNVVYNENMEHSIENIKLASLKRLILEHCPPHGSTKDDELELLILSIHSITSAEHFLRILVTLFDFDVSKTNYETRSLKPPNSLRMNIINFMKKWVNYHGLFIGRTALRSMINFFDRILSDPKYDNPKHDNQKPDIKKYVRPIKSKIIQLRNGVKKEEKKYNEEPVIPSYQVLLKNNLTILEPDPKEVARQITLLTHQSYKSIHSLEFFIALKSHKETLQTPTLNNFFLFLEKLTCLFAESFLKAEDKFTAYLQIYGIISQLYELKNYQIVACLSQLMLRPDLLSFQSERSEKEKTQLSTMQGKLRDLWSSVSEAQSYEKIILSNYDSWIPSIPNMYLEMFMIDDDILQMPDHIDGLINWRKYRCIAKRCAILYRFQNDLSYSYYPIPQIQNVINKGPKMTTKEIEDTLNNYINI